MENILPPSKALQKSQAFLVKRNATMAFINACRRRLYLPEIDWFWNPIKGTEPPTAKLFGSMLAAIAKAKQERLGQLWALMRVADKSGSGWLPKEVVYNLWDTSPANMRRIIRQGVEAGYFRVSGDYIGYVSEAKLAAQLGISRVDGYAVEIPIPQLRQQDIVKLRSLFYDAFHSGRKGDNPLARGSWKNHHEGTIKDLTGRSRPSQRRYERARGVAVRSNYQDLGKYNPEDLQAIRAGEVGVPGQPAFVMRMGKGRGARIVKRLSNDYTGTLKTVKRSRKWLNKRIEKLKAGKALRTSCDNLGSIPQPVSNQFRLYHTDKQRALQVKEQANNSPSLYVYDNSYQPAKGVLWSVV